VKLLPPSGVSSTHNSEISLIFASAVKGHEHSHFSFYLFLLPPQISFEALSTKEMGIPIAIATAICIMIMMQDTFFSCVGLFNIWCNRFSWTGKLLSPGSDCNISSASYFVVFAVCAVKKGNLQRITLIQWCSNFLTLGPHLSFRNPSRATRINNLNENSLKNSLKWSKC